MSNVRDFGAAGDGTTDDTRALMHALIDGDGQIELPRGDYRVTRPIVVELKSTGRTSLTGSGGVARILMHGPGPAVVLKGTHATSADPAGFRPEEWVHERMPTITGLEIVGMHPEADGVRIEGVMQPMLAGVLVREVRTAVHVTGRARNLIVSGCHFFHNTGVGLHLDRVNLHQAIVSNSHISYCRLGGVRIEGSEIRNLQITGNDIEYNNNRSHQVPDADGVPSAEIYIDATEGTVREGTIAGNTLQATYSPGGANVRLIGRSPDENHKVGMWTISGNLIGSQATNIHLTSARGVTISGNYIYSGHNRNLLVESSQNIVVGANCFGHNPDYGDRALSTGIRLVDSTDCNISGAVIQDSPEGRHTVAGAVPVERDGLVEIVGCRRVNVNGSHVLDGVPYGLFVRDSSDILVTGCTILDTRPSKRMKAAVAWTGDGAGNLIATSRIGSGTDDAVILPPHVRQAENLFDD